MKIGRQETVSVYLRPEQREALKRLSKATGIPQTELMRQGIDLVLKKYERRKKR